MIRPEFEPLMFDFGMEGFDVNSAFQQAMSGVITDEELELNDKVSIMEKMITEGSSEAYRNFVDFRSLAGQMEMMCNHDHMFGEAARSNGLLSKFMDSHSDDDGHNHDKKQTSSEDEYDIDPKTGKKKKKKRNIFSK